MAEVLDQSAWIEIIRPLLRYAAQPHENIEDILAGGLVLGQRRALILSRGFSFPMDVPYGLSLFTWWPIKSSVFPGSHEYLLERRWRLFSGASSNEEVRERIVEAVPADVLRLELDELFYQLRTRHIEDIIRL